MTGEHYDKLELDGTLKDAIDEFRKLLNCDNEEREKKLPSPEGFSYLHEYKEYDYKKGEF
jgi:hypothetical protein